MAKIKATDVAALRKKTGLSMMDCKKALEESGGDEKKAIEILEKKSKKKVDKKSGRETKSGLIDTYVHDGKIGVMVEVLAETDFVAKNEQFKEFVHNIALHVAAANPLYLTKEDVPEKEAKKQREIYKEEALSEGKPENIVDKIVEGKMNKYFEEVCLINQPYIKDQDQDISDLLSDTVAKIGENIRISRFERFELGE